jgi:hypothetical protein
MEITGHDIEGKKIVRLKGCFSDDPAEIETSRESIKAIIEGHTGPIIFHFIDISDLRDIHVGVMLWALPARAGRAAVAIVSEEKHIRDIFVISDGLLRAFKTEEEAINALPN